MSEKKLIYADYKSPIGILRLIKALKGLLSNLLIMETEKSRWENLCTINELEEVSEAFVKEFSQLNEYFNAKRKSFDIPLDLTKGTEFQIKVWKELLKIPYDTTISYSELAYKIGNQKAVRAVGLANGKNPIPIIIPCHRVIRKDGSIGGYRGGIKIKKKLLNMEMNSKMFS